MKRRHQDDEDEVRQQRILDQLKRHGRIPTPPPGYYHDTGEKQQQRKNRKRERTRLRDLARSHNKGFNDE